MRLRNMLIRLHDYLQSIYPPMSNPAMIPARNPVRDQRGPRQRKVR